MTTKTITLRAIDLLPGLGNEHDGVPFRWLTSMVEKARAIVPDDEEIIVSTNRGAPAAYDGTSPAGRAFHNIARRVMGENVPFLDLDSKPGMFNRILSWFRSG